jgi:serine/threonine protein kinase
MTEAPSIQLNDLRPGSLFLTYQLLEQVGVGGQGVVWSALDQPNHRIVAIKFNEIPKTDREIIEDMTFERQASKLIALHHPNVLSILDIGLAGQIRYLVSPYITGGSLTDRLKPGPLSSGTTLRFAAQISAALDYLHGEDVIHRDLKPGNILLDLSQTIFVSDFGLARVVSDTTSAMHTGRGTPPYAPPEQHTMGKMLPQSDIFSFGIMLYEMFTGQLPWNGDKVLGMQQLYSKDVIPDPCEVDPNLPPALVNVLRRMTAANPAERTRSAGDALRMLEAIFQFLPDKAEKVRGEDVTVNMRVDEPVLLQETLIHGETTHDTVSLSLTKFAVIDMHQKQSDIRAMPPELQSFMLQNALSYGHNDDFWWKQIAQPRLRLAVAVNLMSKGNEVIAERIINHLIRDPDLHNLKEPLPVELTSSLLNLAGKADNPFLGQQGLEALRLLTPARREWREIVLNPEQDQALAEMALADTPQSDEAALLIGHLRSLRAVRVILNGTDEDRRIAALMAIQQTAGNLPASAPLQVRLGISLQWMFQRLFGRPLALLSAYGMAFLGVTLGFGLHVYLSYRLPGFFSIDRFKVGLYQGAFVGAMVGFGILLTRLFVERLSNQNGFLRTLTATVSGGIAINVALIIYDGMYLYRIPDGFLTTVGCVLIALGFALGGLTGSRFWKMVISFLGMFAALAGSWWTHLALAPSPLNLTPVFTYEYAWPALQVLVVMTMTALLVTIPGNLVDISYREEE